MGRTWICLILTTFLMNSRGAPLNLPGNQLRSVTTSHVGNQMVVQLISNGDFRFEKYELDNPKRLIIDLIRLKNAVRPSLIPVNSGSLRQISVTQFRTQNPPITRITLTLAAATPEYTVGRLGNQLRVVINDPIAATPDEISSAAAPITSSNLSLASPTSSSAQNRQISASPTAISNAPGSQSRLPVLSAAAAPPPASTESPASSVKAPSPSPPVSPAATSGAAPSSPDYFSVRTMQPNPRQIRVKPYLERPFGSPTPESAKPAAEEPKVEKPVEASVAVTREEPVKSESQPQAAVTPTAVAILPPPEIPKDQPINPLKPEATAKDPKATDNAVPIATTDISLPGSGSPKTAADLLVAESKALKADAKTTPSAAIATQASPEVTLAPAAKGSEVVTTPTPAAKETAESVKRKESKISIRSKTRNSTAPQIVPVRILARDSTLVADGTPTEVKKAVSEPSKEISPPAISEKKTDEALKKVDVRIESGSVPPKPTLAVAEQPPAAPAVLPVNPPQEPTLPNKDTSAPMPKAVLPAPPPATNPQAANAPIPPPIPAATETPEVTRISEPVPIVMSPEAALNTTLGPAAAAAVKQAASAKPLTTFSPASKLPAGRSTSTNKISRQPSAAVEPNSLPQQLTPVAPKKPDSTAPSSTTPAQAGKVGLAAEAASQTALTQYTGEPIDFNVKDLDLVDFFRMMAQVSGLNISVDPDVGGRITMTMGAVPWDQIFDLALLTHRLEKKIEGNVVRIAKKETLQSEEAAKKSLKQAVEDATDTQFMALKLNYADAKLLAGSLTDQLSARGKVLFDERTNTIIVSDVPKKLVELSELIKQLDISEPQVLIESRIVQATRNFAREIGVNFGFVTGNGQRVTVGAPPFAGTQIPGLLNSNVNLGGARNNGQVGIKLGNIVDTLLLDAAISAGEQKGVAKLLSEPKVYAQNNREAIIRQGVRFPIQIVQNNTVSIMFQDAALSLRATPKITDEDTILLTLKVENNVADFTRSVNGIPSIQTSESETKVLIPNGGTTVIGGILVDEDRITDDRVPGLASVPVFGHLFKKRNSEKRTEEVLFFITPKIER